MAAMSFSPPPIVPRGNCQNACRPMTKSQSKRLAPHSTPTTAARMSNCQAGNSTSTILSMRWTRLCGLRMIWFSLTMTSRQVLENRGSCRRRPTGRKVEQGWCCAFDGVFPVWLGYDFGVPVTIDHGLWGNRAPLTWEVQASDDGTNYTTITNYNSG